MTPLWLQSYGAGEESIDDKRVRSQRIPDEDQRKPNQLPCQGEIRRPVEQFIQPGSQQDKDTAKRHQRGKPFVPRLGVLMSVEVSQLIKNVGDCSGCDGTTN